MQTTHFTAKRHRAFTMLLAIPAAAGLLTWGGAVGPSSALAATRTASGVAATSTTTRMTPTAITLSPSRSISVSG